MRWEGPPTDNKDRSGKVKDTGGSFFGEKKGLKGGKLENCRRIPVHPVSAIRGGEGDVVADKLGRFRQKGLLRRGKSANQSSWGKGSEDRVWKGLGWANRDVGARLNVFGLVLSCRIMSYLSDPVLLGKGTRRR